jgi:hypothetical protein
MSGYLNSFTDAAAFLSGLASSSFPGRPYPVRPGLQAWCSCPSSDLTSTHRYIAPTVLQEIQCTRMLQLTPLDVWSDDEEDIKWLIFCYEGVILPQYKNLIRDQS